MMKKRNIRKRRAIDDEKEESPSSDDQDKKLSTDEIKLLQKQRQRRTVRLYALTLNLSGFL